MFSLIRPGVVLLLAVAAAACSPDRGWEAMTVLRDIAAAGALDGDRPRPRRIPVRYTAGGRAKIADLYVVEGAKAGVVLVPGAARAGKDDPRLVAFAHALARARFAVLVPDIANLRALKVAPSDAREVADAVRYLSARTAGTAGADVGLVAISYAAGPAILAALEPGTRQKVRFVLAIGGYYDLDAAITFFTTGYYRERPGAAWRYRRPNDYGKWVFVRGNADRLADPADRIAIAAMAERKLVDPRADIDDLVPGLRAEGRSIYALLRNRDPEKTAGLVAALPASVRADITALDLKRRDLGALEARLFLIHGRDDPIIPYTESRALAAAGGNKARFYLVDSMKHTDIGPAGLGDTYTLWRAVYGVLAERDTMSPITLEAVAKPAESSLSR